GVEFMYFAPPRGNGVHLFQLGKKKRTDYLARQVGRPDIDPGVLIDLSSDEFAAIGSLFANDLGAFDHLWRIDTESSSLPAYKVLGVVKAIGAQSTDRSQGSLFVKGIDSLRCVFQDDQLVPGGYFHNGVHLARYSGVMDHEDGSCALGYRILNQGFVDVQGVG